MTCMLSMREMDIVDLITGIAYSLTNGELVNGRSPVDPELYTAELYDLLRFVNDAIVFLDSEWGKRYEASISGEDDSSPLVGSLTSLANLIHRIYHLDESYRNLERIFKIHSVFNLEPDLFTESARSMFVNRLLMPLAKMQYGLPAPVVMRKHIKKLMAPLNRGRWIRKELKRWDEDNMYLTGRYVSYNRISFNSYILGLVYDDYVSWVTTLPVKHGDKTDFGEFKKRLDPVELAMLDGKDPMKIYVGA